MVTLCQAIPTSTVILGNVLSRKQKLIVNNQCHESANNQQNNQHNQHIFTDETKMERRISNNQTNLFLSLESKVESLRGRKKITVSGRKKGQWFLDKTLQEIDWC